MQGHSAGFAQVYVCLFGEWLPAFGEVPRDSPPFEVYLGTPQDTALEDLITLNCAPLQ
ncbi:GyrI-like domain-containing protein [Pacificibacter maritimus]|uniref:GyrI-like domain-containing protein n=1 Tax=Pacificibacter maritimus TaxID=762213 RepID=UPI00319EB900